MAEGQEQSTPAGESTQQAVDNNVGSANAPDAGRVAFMERPDYVPEQFYKDGHVDFKAMAESYGELRKKMDSGKPADPKPTGDANAPASESKPDANALQAQTTTIPGVTHDNMQRYTKELTEGGKLADTSYAELAKLGYPKAVVDAYVKGLTVNPDAAAAQAVERQKFIDQTIDGIGGKSVLTDMISWAGQNLSEADLKVYNESVSSNDPARVKQAVNGLFHAYSQEVGVDPKPLNGRTPSVGDGIEPFASNDEVVAAMSSRKYATDAAYRAEVERRIAVSNVFGQSVDLQDKKDPEKRVYRYQS